MLAAGEVSFRTFGIPNAQKTRLLVVSILSVRLRINFAEPQVRIMSGVPDHGAETTQRIWTFSVY
jgi:hypothetical protein